ncbi:stomatin family protein [Rhodotorula toruloides]|uniref:Stomatin family protein n=1 Tax=Rhodotorula toruloides TaxID=5286 RepID=A0A511KGS8_RHOTO|nr:stomatin family protein [Rhodotorula toruloides]
MARWTGTATGPTLGFSVKWDLALVNVHTADNGEYGTGAHADTPWLTLQVTRSNSTLRKRIPQLAQQLAMSHAHNDPLKAPAMSMDHANGSPTLDDQPTRETTTDASGLVQVQPLRKADMQQSYAQTLPVSDIEHGCYGSMINCLGGFAGTLGSIPCCILCPNPYKTVRQGHVGLVTRFGQFYRAVDPGLVKINPFSERMNTVNVQIQVVELPNQSVLTKDNLTVQVEAVIIYHIINPYKAAFGVADVRKALVERAQTTLRDVIGGRNLQSLLTEREAVASEIEELVEAITERWGVKVENILLKDVLIPPELQASLSSAAQQRRLGEAKVIAAQAEVDSARLMREAADILSSSAAIQIRQLEALQSMAKTAGSKVIFVPMNLFGGGQGGSGDNGLVNNTAMMSALAGPSREI